MNDDNYHHNPPVIEAFDQQVLEAIRETIGGLLAKIASKPLGFILILNDSSGQALRCVSNMDRDVTRDLLAFAGQHAAKQRHDQLNEAEQ